MKKQISKCVICAAIRFKNNLDMFLAGIYYIFYYYLHQKKNLKKIKMYSFDMLIRFVFVCCPFILFFFEPFFIFAFGVFAICLALKCDSNHCLCSWMKYLRILMDAGGICIFLLLFFVFFYQLAIRWVISFIPFFVFVCFLWYVLLS